MRFTDKGARAHIGDPDLNRTKALTAELPHNQVTIAFGLDRDEADRLATAYRRFRGRNIGIEDILRPTRNAVLLWKGHPSPEDEATIRGCLK